jgi:hypothetical protein
MKTEDHISKTAFFREFHTMSSALYGQFCERVARALEPTLDRAMSVELIGFRSRWKDAGGNIHCSLNGKIRRLDEAGDIRGEIVLLRKSASFRGWVTHDLQMVEDWEWVEGAREEFKQGRYSECLRLLSLLKDRATLTRANLRMEEIADERTSNQSIQVDARASRH